MNTVPPETQIAASFSDTVTNGAVELATNPIGYLATAIAYPHMAPLFADLVVEECKFPLSRQLAVIQKYSERFAIPLSPLGLTTMYTAGLSYASNLIFGGDMIYGDRSKKGELFSRELFHSGASAVGGLWVIQTPSAADIYHQENYATFTGKTLVLQGLKPEEDGETTAEEIRERKESYRQNSKLIIPTEEDLQTIDAASVHEAFHSVFNYMRANRRLNSEFAHNLLNEVLAYRVQVAEGIYTREFVKQLLLDYYFDGEEPENKVILKGMDGCLQTAYYSFDPEYQAEVSWRAFICNTVWEFIEPDNELCKYSQALAKEGQASVIPAHSAKLQMLQRV